MKKLLILPAFALGLLMVGCGGGNDKSMEDSLRELQEKLKETGMTKVTVDSLGFSIDLPTGMNSTTVLQAGAPFQYANGAAEQYIVGIYEPQKDAADGLEVLAMAKKDQSFVQNYMDYTLELLKTGVTIGKQETRRKLMIDGCNAETVQLDGTVSTIPVPITYFITIIETKDKVFKFITWTLQSKKDEYKSTANDIITSIKFK